MGQTNSLAMFLDLCHRLYARGLVPGSGGNASVRLGDRIVITPSGLCLGTLAEEDLVSMTPDGSVIGDGKPSKEWRMHLRCYEREDVTAVIHVHSIYSVAVSCLKQVDPACAIPVYTPGYAARVGKLPLVPYMRAGSPELADSIVAAIAQRNSVLLANHGVLATGTSADQAFNLVEEIEENARLHFILNGAGKALSEEQQEDLVGKY